MTPTNASTTPANPGRVEPMLTVQKAAEILGVRVWALRRAVKSGTIPAYTPFNSRKLVRLSEVEAAISAAKVGRANG
ncbi:helix-turn-helix domain-containing protein [Ensifer sp. PDNC004]|uniref:helix-turn-helix domain-containing protein n=1 Tax=Ensifer sp. PDNC004 TaxID=2811423 RepID=UPI001965CA60|nr:helix-turn-helix domain-containing protein [Ensifer sp. PDNC004]QRY67286.1 helix-turn-helix domain-containing protein [Ensifer sp. PDNC004]